MKKSTFSLLSFFAVALIGAPLLNAHSVWIEDTKEKQLVLRFGEADKFETSPGYLDSLSQPIAWTPAPEDKNTSIEVAKKSDHFLFVGSSPATLALAETAFPVMGKPGKAGTRPFFYVRWQPAGAPAPVKPALTIDILPTDKTDEFRVYFRGQPLPEAKVTQHGAGEDKDVKLTADSNGIVKITSHAGLNVLTANHREMIAGFAGGSEYERLSHNVALTWRKL